MQPLRPQLLPPLQCKTKGEKQDKLVKTVVLKHLLLQETSVTVQTLVLIPHFCSDLQL